MFHSTYDEQNEGLKRYLEHFFFLYSTQIKEFVQFVNFQQILFILSKSICCLSTMWWISRSWDILQGLSYLLALDSVLYLSVC